MQVFGLTHIGKIRSNNEDSLGMETALNTVIVADGMGGASCGEVASAITVESVLGYLAAPSEITASSCWGPGAVHTATPAGFQRISPMDERCWQ